MIFASGASDVICLGAMVCMRVRCLEPVWLGIPPMCFEGQFYMQNACSHERNAHLIITLRDIQYNTVHS